MPSPSNTAMEYAVMICPFFAQLGAKASGTQTRKMVDDHWCFLPWWCQAFDRRQAVFAVTVLFDVLPGQMEAFLPRMIDNAKTSRDIEPGCQQFDVCQQGDQVFSMKSMTTASHLMCIWPAIISKRSMRAWQRWSRIRTCEPMSVC